MNKLQKILNKNRDGLLDNLIGCYVMDSDKDSHIYYNINSGESDIKKPEIMGENIRILTIKAHAFSQNNDLSTIESEIKFDILKGVKVPISSEEMRRLDEHVRKSAVDEALEQEQADNYSYCQDTIEELYQELGKKKN